MSFAVDINTLLTSDPSLNEYADGGIHYENLIDNWLAETDDDVWIYYVFNKSTQNDCINTKNVYMDYSLSVNVIQRDTNTEIDIITDRLIEFLNNYGPSGQFIDIGFLRDQGGMDQQRGVYVNSLEFQCQYMES